MSDKPKATPATPANDPDAPVVDAPLPVTTAPPHDEQSSASVPKAPQDMVRLTLPTKEGGKPFSGELQIGHSVYAVVDGVVIVPPWHADDARAAGYQG